LQLWQWCHVAGVSGPTRVEWPDPGGLASQCLTVVRVFDLISEQVELETEQRSKLSGSK